eukprot:TRINITY_DN6984_c0_g1_i4.p1 TRINITY_DN6984_c0_g1~~TRINITY_DN6984_c0_g1_i4.p1  ORF type:complete len:180 (-),score=30.45 TRINITY_DN6984_c0_g1_i4:396-935(-)
MAAWLRQQWTLEFRKRQKEDINLICFEFEEPPERPIIIDGAITIRDKKGYFSSVRMPEVVYRYPDDRTKMRVLRAFCLCPRQKNPLITINERVYRTVGFDDSAAVFAICEDLCGKTTNMQGGNDEKPLGNDVNDGFNESSTIDYADNSTDDFDENFTNVHDDNLNDDFDATSIHDNIDE